MKIKLAALIISTATLASCATSEKVQVAQMGDNSLSCDQLKNEISRIDSAQKEIDSKKGMTGTNVASALFWLPGLAYTYYDAGEATKAVSDRRSHLVTLYTKQSCR